MEIKALLFDLDGTLADTQNLHAESESAVLQEVAKVSLNADRITEKYAGRVDTQLFQEILQNEGLSADPSLVERLVLAKWREVERRLAEENILEIPGAVAFVRSVTGLPCALASSSPLAFIEAVLQKLQIRSCFQALASGKEVARGKPAPDVFLLAADRLGVDPRHCLVWEDSSAGVQAALAAGMQCVSVGPLSRAPPAHLHLADFLGRTWESVQSHFPRAKS